MRNCVCTRWVIDISEWTPTLLQLVQAVTAVQMEERCRLIKFHFMDDFLCSLVGRLLMRKFVSDASGVPYHNVKLARDVRGKPHWAVDRAMAATATAAKTGKQLPQLSFNVSHQNDFVVLAGVVATKDDNDGVDDADNDDAIGIGVDVMKIEYSGGKSLTDFFRLMHKKFSDHEWRYITRAPHNETDRLKAFMRHWCLKEAYVKEIGVGITIDLQKMSFNVDRNKDLDMSTGPLTNTTLRFDGALVRDFHFEEHLLHPKYCTAIAFKNCKPVSQKFDFLSIDDLLAHSQHIQLDDDPEVLQYCRRVLQKQRKHQFS